jgi:hypothetical protein
LIIWVTPMDSPLMFLIGIHKMLRVTYPVCLSTSGLKRESL